MQWEILFFNCINISSAHVETKHKENESNSFDWAKRKGTSQKKTTEKRNRMHEIASNDLEKMM